MGSSVEQSALCNHPAAPKMAGIIAVHLAQTSAVMGQGILVCRCVVLKSNGRSRNFVVKAITLLPTLQILQYLVIAPEQHNSTLECQTISAETITPTT